jgi:hypothetical protein
METVSLARQLRADELDGCFFRANLFGRLHGGKVEQHDHQSAILELRKHTVSQGSLLRLRDYIPCSCGAGTGAWSTGGSGLVFRR